MPKEVMTNCELIEKFIHHPNGMNQILMISAMDSYVDWVLSHKEHIKSAWATSLINPDAWIASAQAWKDACEARAKANKNLLIITVTN